jgi:hypothetical protein
MITRCTSLALAMALVCTVGGPSVLAATPSITGVPGSPSTTVPASSTSAPKKQTTDQKLRAGLDKLVADAKAGKLAPNAPPQNRTARGNNLSDGVKVAIGVGIAVALVILVVTHKRGRTYDRDLGCAVAGTC